MAGGGSRPLTGADNRLTTRYGRRLAHRLVFRILGPLSAELDGRPLNLGGARQRGVLALLLLHANEVVSTDRLIDGLWGDAPPADAAAALQAHVSRLRKVLEPAREGDPEVLVTAAPGYLVRAGPDELDLLRFEALLADGRRRLAAGDGSAGEVLREALALWRGRPLADLEAEPFAQEAIRALDDSWLEAVEARIDADLDAGRHAELVRELSALVRRHPLRERVRGQLMLALYRSGRQAEALDAYADLRRGLDDQLGLHPGPELQELQQAILRQDPALERRSPRSRPSRARRRRGPVAAAAATAAAAIAVLALTAGSGGEPAAAGSAGSVVGVDPRTGEIEARVGVGATPSAVAVGEGHVWVLNGDAQTLSRIDPRSRRAETFAIGAPPTDVAAGMGGLWVGAAGRARGVPSSGLVATALSRLDAETRTPRATVSLPVRGTVQSGAVADHVAVGAGAVWVVGPDGRVHRVEPRTDRITATVPGVRARGVAVDGSDVWALAGDGRVMRIDPRSGSVVARGRVGASAVASITAGQGGAWVSAPADGRLWRVLPGRADGLVLRSSAVSKGTTDLAYGEGALWAVNPLRGTLAQVDPGSDAVERTIAIGGFPRSVAVGEDAVWVATSPSVPAARAQATGIRPLPDAMCERPFTGGDQPPQRLIVADLPLQGGLRLSSQQMADAMAFVLRRDGFRAGRWRVALQACDDAVASTRLPDRTKCAANARAYSRHPEVLAVVGPVNSDCALAAIPELNRAQDPLALVSPQSSYVGLTRSAPGTPPDELASLYPSGRRTFLRVLPADGHQVAALALLAQRLDRLPVYVLDDGNADYGGLFATQFERAARRLGLPLAGRSSWNPGAPSHRSVAERVARVRPRAVFLGGGIETGGPAVVRALRERLGPAVPILTPDAFTPTGPLAREAGREAAGVYVALGGIADPAQLGPEGRRFAREFSATLGGEDLEPSAIYAAQAMEVVLDAIGRSDGTRTSVLDALFATRIERGIIGNVSFDGNGDIETSPVTILRLAPGARALRSFPDAVVDRVLQVPVELGP